MPDHLPQDAGEKSLWGSTAIANPVNHRLEESLQADVLIVGGGYTGLSSALHLAEQGVSVVLLRLNRSDLAVRVVTQAWLMPESGKIPITSTPN